MSVQVGPEYATLTIRATASSIVMVFAMLLSSKRKDNILLE